MQGSSVGANPHDPGPGPAAARAPSDAAGVERTAGGGLVRVGTAGWTDPSLTASGVFYPPGTESAGERLGYYAGRFSVVEVDSSYYALPSLRNAQLWAERTPPDFVFDLKAHALMTGQPTEVSRLPRPIREALPAHLATQPRIYGKDLPADAYDRVWTEFAAALRPLKDAGKLGSVLLQYPRWFGPGPRSLDTILEARDRLGDIRCAVEFRNGLWFRGLQAERTLRFLTDHDLPFVMVDGPQGLGSSIPPIAAVTSPALAIVRFHGRRTETWEKPGVGVAERFRYLYDASELGEWTSRVREAASQAGQVHVIMNNCHANYGTTNALEFAKMLREDAGPGLGL